MGIKISTDAWVSVDTVKVVAPLGDLLSDPFPDFSYGQKTSNKITIAVFGMRNKVEGRYLLHNLAIKHDPVKNVLIVEGSPAGILLGQNVFGERNPMVAGYAMLRYACEKLKLPISDQLYSRWAGGDFKLERVDLAVNFRLSNREKVTAILKQMGLQLVVQNVFMRKARTGIYYAPGKGAPYSIVCYEKGAEMQHRLRSVLARGGAIDRPYQRLAARCRNVLRIELRLQRQELKKLELIEANAWDDDIAHEVFKEYVEKMPVHKVLRVVERKEIWANAKTAGKLFMIAHQYYPGPMTDIYRGDSYKTLRSRYGKSWGVDLKVRPTALPSFIPSLQISDVQGNEAYPFSFRWVNAIGWDRLPTPPDTIVEGVTFNI
ncbi:MAG: phage/plasmid replication protein, II/X family [Bordetella sp.]|uniref:phage/plasmid replication protein, II/X family n=1 Tax=Bordetella sp. TaxID=28081 RepID=UPI003F7BE0F2